jgi:hypothetical protein
LPARKAKWPGFRRGPLRVLLWQGPTLLNPHFATGTKDEEGCAIFYESLARWDTDGNLEAVLAAEIPSRENGGLPADLKAGSVTGRTIQRGIGSPQECRIQPHRWAAGAGSDPQAREGSLAGRNTCGGLATDRQIPTP